jgi:hypothetical protein
VPQALSLLLSPRGSTILLCSLSALAASVASCSDGDEPPVEQGELMCEIKPSKTFQQRIEPLLAEERPTTCNQCHLSGVDLTAFARDTPCKTWACLVEDNLVNVDEPAQSRILSWILRASPESELITDEVIQAEHDGFLEWIEANAACPSACAGVECGEPGEGPTCSDGNEEPEPEVPSGVDERGCTDLELEQAFMDDIYAWRGRCYPCHFDTELEADPDAPRWLSLIGNCETGSAVSLARVLGLGLIDVDEPTESLLLLKPLDASGGGVEHGGGEKFASTMDPSYQSFLRFARHYAECQAQAQ